MIGGQRVENARFHFKQVRFMKQSLFLRNAVSSVMYFLQFVAVWLVHRIRRLNGRR